MKQALSAFLQGDLTQYNAMPFWSWNNALDEKVLQSQIQDMYDSGIGGFIMHARTGLTDEYLGEKWFSCIGACLEKARELGMQAWAYDENGWPSGFVGGKLLENPDFLARYLEYRVGPFDGSAFAIFVPDELLGFRRVDAPQEGVGEYHHVYRRVNPANTDILNPAVVEAFLQETHEQYYKRFGDSFGRELKGFFTDEPQYFRWATPYTAQAEPYFADIRDGLIWLFVHDSRGWSFRVEYYRVLNKLYTENFYKRLYDWCESHNCQLTGHTIEERTLAGQMWGGAAVMPSYEFEHMPGIDKLGRTCSEDLMPKQVASVAAQLGKHQILTETFACCGNDVTPGELRAIAQSQYFHGVNRLCHHLYPYSIAGQGKMDHPPVFGRHSNWMEEFKDFNDYFTRLGALIANTEERVQLAILHPQRNIWLEYIRTEDKASVQALEDSFQALLLQLRKAGVGYHLVDEWILQRHGSLEGDCLRVGRCLYSQVLVPEMTTLAPSSYEILENFSGKLCLLGGLTCLDGKRADIQLSGNASLEEILDSNRFGFSCQDGNSFITRRESRLGRFLFLQNTNLEESSQVALGALAQRYAALDLMTLEEKPVSPQLTLEPGDGLVLVESEQAGQALPPLQPVDVTENFAVTGLSDNYFVLDRGEIALENGAFSQEEPIQRHFEHLLRLDYKGIVTVRQRFRIAKKMPLTLIVEKADFLSLTVNGRELTLRQNGLDVNFREADLGSALVEGENVIQYSFRFYQHEGVHYALFSPEATESLTNCLYYDTSLENVYLRGLFLVKDGILVPQAALPALTGRLCDAGYPYFMGSLTLSGTLEYRGGAAVLELGGRFLVARIRVGNQEKKLVMDRKADLTGLLVPGENRVEITLKSSLRNLFGPHHAARGNDTFGVNPECFSFRGQWEGDNVPVLYSEEPIFVPFGMEKITFWH